MIYTLDDIKRIVQPIAVKYNVETVYLFGSYARGEATSESDLDFFVFGGSGFMPVKIFELAEELREAFEKPVDVFEIREVDQDSSFYEKIMKEKLRVL